MDKDALIELLSDALDDTQHTLDCLATDTDNSHKQEVKAVLFSADAALNAYFENRSITTAQSPFTLKIPFDASDRKQYIAEFERLNGLIPIL